MTTVFEIPLQPSRPQSFSITLGGITYGMRFQWRDALAQCWIMDLSDGNGVALVAGIPLLTGADLMAQYPDIGFPGELWIATDADPNAPPTFDNIGVESHLYFVVP